jgi:deoxyribodipyrimidine photolyase
MTAIWWIRRHLRLTENPTLHAALETFDQTQDKAGEIVRVFYIEEREKLVMDRGGPRHQGKPT